MIYVYDCICNNIQYNLPGTPAGLSLGLDTCKSCRSNSLLNPKSESLDETFGLVQLCPIPRTHERYR